MYTFVGIVDQCKDCIDVRKEQPVLLYYEPTIKTMTHKFVRVMRSYIDRVQQVVALI